MKIVCVEPLGIGTEQFTELANQFREMGHTFQFHTDRNEDPEELKRRMHDADVVVISNIKLSGETLSACPSLKMLSVAFTGLDHIDLGYCKEHNIEVRNAAGYSTTAVSELAVGLMIDCLRHITNLDGSIRNGGARGSFLGRELKGKTVGIVGTGAIGTETMRLLKAFGCRILAYNRSIHPEAEALGAKYVSLDDLLSQSDIVSLHLPLNESTYHTIGAEELRKMKPTSILINTARGNVTDIAAVAEALCKGTIAAAAFDVYEQEPPLANNHPLSSAPNCIMVPHIGYATREAFDIRADIVFNNVREFLSNQQA